MTPSNRNRNNIDIRESRNPSVNVVLVFFSNKQGDTICDWRHAFKASEWPTQPPALSGSVRKMNSSLWNVDEDLVWLTAAVICLRTAPHVQLNIDASDR